MNRLRCSRLKCSRKLYTAATKLCNRWPGQPVVRDHGFRDVYTGRPKLDYGIEYYNQMSSLPESYDREVIQMVHTGSTDSAFLVGRDCRRSVRPGDFVETVARDGQVESGVVLHHDKGLVSLYTADGRTIELLSSLVTFTVKNLVNRTFMDCLEEEGSPSSPLLQHLSNYLKLFIRSSINLSVKMKPYMDVVYAQTASARGIRGVSFDQILRDLFENARIYRPISPSMGLCAYLLLKESSFGRFCADSPEFFPLPERSPEGVDDVLKSYLVYPDPKLQPFVNKNMSELYPERDTDSWLTAPNSVYQMLKETGKIDGNPLLVKGSNFWKTSDGEIHDDVEEKLTSMLNKGLRKKSVLAHKEWNELPVYAFSHSHDIAFSLDMRKPDSWTLYLHIIDLSHSIGFQDGPLLDLLQYRGKSVRLKEGMRSLFPESFRFRTGFTRANNQPVQCLTLSVEIQPWEPVEWNMGHVNAQFTSINNSAIQYFDGQKVDESMGWKYERIGDELFNILDIKEDKSSLLTINRATRYHLTCIREIIEKHYWKRMDAAQIPSNVQTFEDQTLDWYSGSRKIVQEARIFAGHLCSLFGLRERLKLPSIDRSLGLPSYTEVGYPMDSLFSMIPQWQIRNLLERRAFEETNKTLVLTKPTNIETYIDQKIRPQDSLIDYLYNRIQRFHKLSNLQDKIRQTSGYYIFRCIVNEDAQYPHIASAFCPELDMDVEVVLVPNARLYAGDRILCNQIQEISPVDGLLVLCI